MVVLFLGLRLRLLALVLCVDLVDRVVGLWKSWQLCAVAAAKEHLGRAVAIGTWLVPKFSETVLEIIIEQAITFL